MLPPYTLTTEILKLISEVSLKLGEVNASFITRQSPELRKRNRIKTIQASLAVEGNTLSVEQVTAIIENKRVHGSAKDIKEVENAIKIYAELHQIKPLNEQSFLSAHKVLMKDLIVDAGKYRSSGAGILKGNHLAHVAPPAKNVPFLIKDLFLYLKKSTEPALIKSCVFHYEVEFIHPFSDGNGRMGRLWQTLLLMQEFPVFAYLPFETLISKNQKSYYKALSISDKQGASTVFIAFMLGILSDSLNELLKQRTGPLTSNDRLALFLSSTATEFTRRDYLNYFKTLSTATASRDLKQAVDLKMLRKGGEKSKTVYRQKK